MVKSNIIVKLIQLYKMFTFTSDGGLEIKYNGSKIRLTKEGDIIIQAARHTIHKRQLFFDGCDDKFINQTIKKYNRGKKEFEEHLDNQSLSNELTCEIKNRGQLIKS